ncbi:MarR family winged helix-turn-helix transcriptional regulator [Anaerocolumna sp. MB42-C2]|uniref:MarR family winged helix-turn-helix transcriptional regulator n=1 Tax=Anaerocolumna sp. MB42-C2 TaxID=3070997 RepID=UPI0027E07E1A|nr:MarR family transcriptional regulator [Anaerocolumna sp. MB42-C2]WMJ86863.1 MarR family transcriptional regulator [Anaerocolumna sp. MB42-C2]
MQEYFNSSMKRFNYLISELDNTYHELSQKLGLSDSAMMILYTICNFGESCLLSDILKLSGASKQTISSALRKLEADGIVYLESFSGKKKMVFLTEKGKLITKKTVSRLITFENEALSTFSEQEQELYFVLTERFLSVLKKKAATL